MNRVKPDTPTIPSTAGGLETTSHFKEPVSIAGTYFQFGFTGLFPIKTEDGSVGG
jgi:hypothetical protein